MSAHYLYRFFDHEGYLLYIGCTSNVNKRISLHLGGRTKQVASRWIAACMDRHEIEGPFSNRDAGRAAEREAIASESPLFNVQEQRVPSSHTYADVARYLIWRGHLDLAVESACTCWPEDRGLGMASPWCPAHIEAGLEVAS